MGWLWNSSEKSASSDPLSRVDPKLREFLDKETPAPSTSTSAAPSPSLQPPKEPEYDAEPYNSTSQSKYGDRYADIWQQYTPIGILEAAAKTDQEKLADALSTWKYRKAAIGRAALENCVFEQLALRNCYQSGEWSKKMTMCSDANRKFETCYSSQTKFLKALGYMADQSRDPAIDERIQMHADKLYQEQLRDDAAAEAARAAKSSGADASISSSSAESSSL
ncbi:hypothetical protein RUND412_001217 [Rhizina undulata]